MQYDLIDLRLFVAIGEEKNLTRGARRVHMAASSASHRIRALEESVGTALLVREPRGVTLTRPGESLLRHARHVLARLEQMHADLSPFADGVKGHVGVWANTHATHAFLPDSLASFLRSTPQVSITLEEHTSPDIVLAVAKGEIEVGVVAGTVEDADVEFIPYRQDRLVVIVPPQHPLVEQRRIHFASVLEYPFVMLHAGSAIHTFTSNVASALGRHLDVRIQVRSFEAVCRMVSAGVGIGLVPLGVLYGNGVAPSPVKIIELDEPWAPRDLNICVQRRERLTGFAEQLVSCLAGD